MSNNDTEDQNTTATAVQNKPFMLGYTVRPIGDGRKSSWSKIAAAWAHKDGQGFEVRMDALPVDGRLVLRTVPEHDQESGEVLDRSPDGLS